MTGKILIFGEVGTDVTIQDIQKQIQANAMATELEVQMSSPGGDVFEGYAIYNLLKNTGKDITTVVVGLCASIATLIAAAGKKIVMNKTAQFMIHNPSIAGLSGDANELRNTADQLDKIKSLLIDVYHRKTGLPNDKLWEMYDNETWLTAAEAGPNGYKFVDDVQDTIRAVAVVDISKFKSMDNKDTTILGRIENGIKRLTNLFKYKNMAIETTMDGKVIHIMSEDDNWVQKPAMYEDGTPLEAGDYVLASGKTITVDANSTITDIQETAAAPEADKPADNTMEDKIKELEAKLKETTDALAAANAAKQSAEAKAKSFENSLKTIEADVTEMKKTFGDKNPPKDGFKQFMNVEDPDGYDPMGEDFKRVLESREII